MNSVFKKGVLYKFEIANRIFYTGKLIKENSTHIEIRTIRNETIILNKNNIIQSIEIEEDR